MPRCPSCTNEISEESVACPSCGAAVESSFAPTRLFSEVQDAPKASAAAGTRRDGGGAGSTSATHRSVAPDSFEGARFVAGDVIAGRYRVVGLLGRGGMGEVYRADDLKLKQTVALKFLPETLSADGAALARFYQEVSLARRVSHRHVCRVYDVGEDEAGQHFLTMEFIRGEELASVIKRFGRLPADKAVEIARQVCAGLHAVHEHGVLHRDLKPANVMIDENGDARLTDFGLAAPAEELRGGSEDYQRRVRAGTPGYMSPEQLAGAELTVRSDIYSLGLVLYEVFTGRKAFEAETLPKLLELRRSRATPTDLSSFVRDIDPVVERVVLRCLEKEPEKRPASALQVAAALPGGDPLAAALAAGETPSPEMVAAAPKEGTLRPAVAAALFAATLAGFVFAAVLAGRATLHRYVPLEKTPEGLRERAVEIVRRLGYTEAPRDSAHGFVKNDEYLRHIAEHDQTPTRWERLRAGQPSGILFWYRQSPRYLVPLQLEVQMVTPEDPPPLVSGMTSALLDPQGRLVRFDAVPPQLEEQNGQPRQAPDWAALFAEAGLDVRNFTPAGPRWVPPVNSDARAAWEGTLSDGARAPVRVEAASYAGRPVYFHLIGPWTTPARMREAEPRAAQRLVQIFFASVILTAIGASAWLARRNLRTGRGDRRGGFRLSLVVFFSSMLGWVLLASHVPTYAEFNLLTTTLALATFYAGLCWLMYVALEPYVRRKWPHRLVSWTRVLGGNWRDPLVGRDVLIGGACGMAQGLVLYSVPHAARLLGLPSGPPIGVPLGTLTGARSLLGEFFTMHLGQAVISFGLLYLFILLLLYFVLRRGWLAALAAWLLFAVPGALANQNVLLGAVLWGTIFGVSFLVLTRFGLLATVASGFFFFAFMLYPLTTDLNAWYASGTIFAGALTLAVASYAFRTSLGGQRLFRGGLPED